MFEHIFKLQKQLKMFKAFDVRDLSLESINKLIATDLIKHVNKSEITVA